MTNNEGKRLEVKIDREWVFGTLTLELPWDFERSEIFNGLKQIFKYDNSLETEYRQLLTKAISEVEDYKLEHIWTCPYCVLAPIIYQWNCKISHPMYQREYWLKLLVKGVFPEKEGEIREEADKLQKWHIRPNPDGSDVMILDMPTEKREEWKRLNVEAEKEYDRRQKELEEQVDRELGWKTKRNGGRGVLRPPK